MNNIYKYLIIINVITFIVYAVDKFKAINKRNRISELTLYSLGFLGGFGGALLAMLLFRHKTKKVRFYVLNILYMIIWLLSLWRFLWK
jgi:uncharacterized membrane protein YsdA (DUF1294 family)